MKKNILIILISCCILLSAALSLAGTPALASCKYNDYTNASTTLCNPLKQNNIGDFIRNIIEVIMGLIGVIAAVMIVIGGFRMVASRGDEGAVKKARETIKWAVLGLVVSALSFSIIAIIENLLISKP